jgi:hypothetical protein
MNIHIEILYIDNNSIKREAEGILWKYDEDPHDIVLLPRYIARCYNKEELINSLFKEDIFEKEYKKDKEYQKQINEKFKKEKMRALLII